MRKLIQVEGTSSTNGQHSKALGNYYKAIALKLVIRVQSYLGDALNDLNRNGEAINSYTRAIRLNPYYGSL